MPGRERRGYSRRIKRAASRRFPRDSPVVVSCCWLKGCESFEGVESGEIDAGWRICRTLWVEDRDDAVALLTAIKFLDAGECRAVIGIPLGDLLHGVLECAAGELLARVDVDERVGVDGGGGGGGGGDCELVFH